MSLLVLPRLGKGFADGVASDQGQVLMVGDVCSDEFVLADYPGDQFLVDFILFFPEADSIGDGDGILCSHSVALL